jgi:glycosyltransferase involved in cell wall biosynthesis
MKILFVTHAHIGAQRAGPAIRTVELARVLSKFHDVTVASAQPGELSEQGIRFLADCTRNQGPLRAAARECDILVAQGFVFSYFPFLRRARYVVFDLHDPFLFEYLAHSNASAPEWGYLRQWHLLNEQMERGDFFICANERQWDYWIGRLCALGRLNPDQYGKDATFRNLLGVVPFGIPSEPPRHNGPGAKGVIDGIGSNDTLLLWCGGIWQWFDPCTLIRAMAGAARERPDIKLLFIGIGRPDNKPEAPIVAEARQLARELGVLDRAVFFHERWLPQAELQNYLLDADVGVATYPDSIETRFSFRTRVRDYIWAGLPMILTRGDSFADWVDKEEFGATVQAGDVEGLTQAILTLASDPALRSEIRARLSRFAPDFCWERVAAPLLAYCEHPYRTRRIPAWRRLTTPFLTRGYQIGARWFAGRPRSD